MNEQALPQGILDIADVIGLPLAIKLMTAYGGIYLPIPKTRDSKIYELLAAEIGAEAADKILQRYADTRLNIPQGAAAARAERNARMRDAYDAGTAVNDLALSYRLTSRQVMAILNAPDEPIAVQIGLF
jgi:Mor family transcriptional regulator